MSVAAVMLVKDEADVLEPVLRHLAWHVDEIIVAENNSTDDTPRILSRLRDDEGLPIVLVLDEEVGYFQSRKTSELAALALARGHSWVVPCDADEVWYVGADIARPISAFLGGQGREVMYVKAELYNHLPTSSDYEDSRPNPLRQIGWRQRDHAPLAKVACKLRDGLKIAAGNHAAWAPGSGLTVGGLVIRHFSWRSPEQYVRKIRNGAAAYAATDLPESTGAHWRMFGDPLSDSFDERVAAHFREWFFVEHPSLDTTLIYDPAPLAPTVV